MVRVGISVEGVTEERFIKQNLTSYFTERDIFIQPISINGNVSIDRIKSELGRLVHNFDYITTFYDFYGFKRKQAEETKQSLEQKISEALKKSMRDKLIPYVQMYEFEGLLFSSPEHIGTILQENKLVGWAQSILQEFQNNPEAINDSPQTAPSKRLENNARYRKTTHGPDIANAIGLPKLRERCQGFNDWLASIEKLTSP